MGPSETGSRRRARTALCFLAVVATSGCFRHAPAPEEDPVTLTVQNEFRLDVNVFNVGRGVRDRLGMVVANTTSTFRIGRTHLGGGGDLQLRAEPIGGARGVTSEVLHVAPGDSVSWTLAVDLSRSWFVLHD